MKVLITGAKGFVGQAILNNIPQNSEIEILATARTAEGLTQDRAIHWQFGDLKDSDFVKELVKGVDVIMHAASWAAMWGNSKKERGNFYEPTLNLLKEAKNAGVKQFILTSTIAANKNQTGLLPDDQKGHKVGFWPHLNYVIDIENEMESLSSQNMQMTSLRLGHFIGKGNKLGLIPALIPRLKTRLVPMLGGGKKLIPLIGPEDIGQAFWKTIKAQKLNPFESINISGGESVALGEVIGLVAKEFNVMKPFIPVPYAVGFAFGAFCELLSNLGLGSPFLARSIVHLASEWVTDNKEAMNKLNYAPSTDWQEVAKEQIQQLKQEGVPWSLKNK